MATNPNFKPAFEIDLRSSVNPETGNIKRAPKGTTSFSPILDEEEKKDQIERLLGPEGNAFRAVTFELLNRRPCPASDRLKAGTTYFVRRFGSSEVGTITLSKNPAYDLGKCEVHRNWWITRQLCKRIFKTDLPKKTFRLNPSHVLAIEDIIPQHGGTKDVIVGIDPSRTGIGSKKKSVYAVTEDAASWLFEPKYPEIQP